MTAEKEKVKKQQKLPRPLLESFTVLFYLCKYLGINSQDLKEFKKYKQLKRSPVGEAYVIITMISAFVNFNLMIWVFENSTYIKDKNTLSLTIGFVLTYFSIFSYLCDRITALVKQQSFGDIFHYLEELDEDFMEFNIILNNSLIKHRIIFNIVVATLMEVVIFSSTFALLVAENRWSSWLWVFTALPTYHNTLDKLWYFGILLAIRKRFEAINNELDKMALKLDMQRKKEYNLKLGQAREKKRKKNCFKNKIQPEIAKINGVFGDVVTNPQLFSTSVSSIPYASTMSSFTQATFNGLEEKLIKLCQLHDGLCGAGKLLNDVWSFPNLVLMGYGFFIVTAQLYFVYCSNAEQTIPTLFRPAQNSFITAIYLLYVSRKCVSILFLSWKTNLEAKKTGICIHRCALAADKDEVYKMVNHFSLKLFNHMLNFNAFGYFPLHMTTLFSFCGGITTYLIILIQFNIEEQQVVKTNSENKPMALRLNETIDDVMGNIVNQTVYENSTSLLNIFFKLYLL